MFTASHTTSKVTLRARVATQPRRVSRAIRHSRSRNAAVGIDDITVIRAEGVGMPEGRKKAMASAKEQIAAL